MADLYEQDNDNLQFIKAKLGDIDEKITVPRALDASHLMKLIEGEAAPKLTVHKAPVRWQRFASVAAAFVIIGGALAYAGLGGLTATKGANEEAMPAAAEAAPQMRAFSGDQPVAAVGGEVYAQSYEQIRTALQAVSTPPTVNAKLDEKTLNPEVGGEPIMAQGVMAEAYTANAQAQNADEAANEADMVKTNGDSIFYLYITNADENASEALYSMVKIVDAKTLEVSSTISLPVNNYASDMLLTGDKLTVIYDNYNFATAPKYTLYEDGWQQTGEQSVAATTLSVYNITDTSNPVSERSFSQQGSYISSYLKDDTVYLATTTASNNAHCDKYSDSDIVPMIKDSAVTTVAQALPASDIFIPQVVNDANYTVLSAINLTYPAQTCTKAVLGGGDTVYMDNETIYVADAARAELPAERGAGLLEFDITGGDIKLWAQGN